MRNKHQIQAFCYAALVYFCLLFLMFGQLSLRAKSLPEIEAVSVNLIASDQIKKIRNPLPKQKLQPPKEKVSPVQETKSAIEPSTQLPTIEKATNKKATEQIAEAKEAKKTIERETTTVTKQKKSN